MLRNHEGLFQSELTGKNRMADHVRKHQPGGVGWKFPSRPRAEILELPILLEKMMEAQHPFVVRRASQTVNPRRSSQIHQDLLWSGSYPPGERHSARSCEARC